MNTLAPALAIAISFISLRGEGNSHDDDLRALEAIVAELQDISTEERKALKNALSTLGHAELWHDLGLA